MTGSVEERLSAISQDHRHGAAFLAREALATMKVAADESKAEGADSFLREIASLGISLISLRPSMSAPIANAVVRLFGVVSERGRRTNNIQELKEAAREAADALLVSAQENGQKTAMNAAQVVHDGATVLTHSYSETCLRALLACAKKGVRVFATESRPLCEGRKTAASLKQGGVEVSLITDAEAGHFMAEAQVVLVGADTVLTDGSVVNKIGTYLIALAARDKAVPFYVACDSWKFRIENGLPELEEKSPGEVLGGETAIKARNVCFDVTPARLVSALITDDGIIGPDEVESKAKKWSTIHGEMLRLAKR